MKNVVLKDKFGHGNTYYCSAIKPEESTAKEGIKSTMNCLGCNKTLDIGQQAGSGPKQRTIHCISPIIPSPPHSHLHLSLSFFILNSLSQSSHIASKSCCNNIDDSVRCNIARAAAVLPTWCMYAAAAA